MKLWSCARAAKLLWPRSTGGTKSGAVPARVESSTREGGCNNFKVEVSSTESLLREKSGMTFLTLQGG